MRQSPSVCLFDNCGSGCLSVLGDAFRFKLCIFDYLTPCGFRSYAVILDCRCDLTIDCGAELCFLSGGFPLLLLFKLFARRSFLPDVLLTRKNDGIIDLDGLGSAIAVRLGFVYFKQLSRPLRPCR